MVKKTALFGLCLVAAGCGGGGGTPALDLGGGGGGGPVSAGPVVLQGQVNQPQTAVTSGVTTYSVTGNITAATLSDKTPTINETEVFYSRDTGAALQIVAGNAFGDGSVRVVADNLAQPATNLVCEPTGKWIYYIRNNNLQRTGIRDGTSNTLISSVANFAFTPDGQKVVYQKLGTEEVWAANVNGSGQTLVGSVPGLQQVVGCQDGANAMIRITGGSSVVYRSIELSGGALYGTLTFVGFTHFWSVYSPTERCIYSLVNGASTYYVYRINVPTTGHSFSFYSIYLSSTPFPFTSSYVGCGPDGRSLFGNTFLPNRLQFASTEGALLVKWPFEATVYGAAWGQYPSSFTLAGLGTPFATGIGAMIFSELSSATPAFVAADAVNRNSVVVTSLNESGNGNPVYQVVGDNLSKLSYMEANAYVWKNVITSPSGLKGAIVSFDGPTGKIANIVTFTKKPTVTRAGSSWKIQGELSEVIDLKHNTRKPAGASVQVN